ncbi:MAG: glycerophosphodiester phosphodiesterase family protein [archaeon]
MYEQDWSDIKQCKYYSLENNMFVTSVDDLFSQLPNLNNWYFSFDCTKEDNEVADLDAYRGQYLRAIKRSCEEYKMSNNIFIEGSEALLLRAQEMGMTNKLFNFDVLTESAIETTKNNHFFGISTSIDWLNNNVQLAHQNGLYVMVWSPNDDAQNQEALNQKADIIQTDDPIDLLRLLNRYNYDYIIP